MLTVLMLARNRAEGFALVCLAALAICAVSACEKVPLMAPVGSSITLSASASALSANDSTVINAQVVEAGGTPPHSGTHITFTTTLGRMLPAEVETDSSGRASTRFIA